MLPKLNTRGRGFTLVEIMIVVAIIAILAAIAVPNFMRARKRTQATRVLEEIRLLDSAKDHYAIEANLTGTDVPTFAQLTPYFKPGSALATNGGTDSLGNPIQINDIQTPPTISSTTYSAYFDVVDDTFWGNFKP